MSDLGLQDDPIFRGRTLGGISCTEFVRSVRKHAITEKMARDNEYIADYAMSCLDDEALLWAETLALEVQSDWSLLRRALLAEYCTPRQSTGISPAVTPSALIPVAAAAAAPPRPIEVESAVHPTVSSIAAVPIAQVPAAAAAPSSLPVSPGCYFVKCVATNTTLNNCGWGDSADNPIIAWRRVQQANSKWMLNLKSGSTTEYCLLNVGNNMPIGYSGSLTGPGTKVTLQDTPAYFTVVNVGGDQYMLYITGTNYVFDVEGSNPNDGTAVLLHPAHGHPNQLWTFEPTEPK